MINLMLAMVVFAFVGAATPGPVNLLAVSTSMNFGLRTATSHVLGASVSYALIVFCCGCLMQFFIHWLPQAQNMMLYLGSAYLLYLSCKLYLSPLPELGDSHSQNAGAKVGALAQLLNPKAWLFALSGINLFVSSHENYHYALGLFTLVSLVICFIGVGLWAMMGQALAHYLENTHLRHYFNQGMAVLLAVSVMSMWL